MKEFMTPPLPYPWGRGRGMGRAGDRGLFLRAFSAQDVNRASIFLKMTGLAAFGTSCLIQVLGRPRRQESSLFLSPCSLPDSANVSDGWRIVPWSNL